MSLKLKYVTLFSKIMPAGAVGISLLLGCAAPGGAAPYPADSESGGADRSAIADRLAAIRQAVSDVASTTAPFRGGEQQLAWGNWRNGGWRNGGWGNWRNGGWRNGGWPNWWHNW